MRPGRRQDSIASGIAHPIGSQRSLVHKDEAAPVH